MRPKKHPFLSCRRGSVAVEFGLVAPFLVLALVGTAEAYGLFQASGKTMEAAFTVADLTAQSGAQTTASLGSIVSAARNVFSPLPNVLGAQLSINIASIGFDATGNPTALWCYGAGGGTPVDVTAAAGLGTSGDAVVAVTVVFNFTPWFSVFPAPGSFTGTALSRPRHGGGPIPLNGNMQVSCS